MRNLHSVCALALLMGFNGMPVPGQDVTAAQAQIDSLVRTLRNSEIESIDVLRLPKGYENVKQVGPEDIESLWFTRMSIRELRPPREALIAGALEAAHVHRSDRKWDLRWGVVFYSRSGNKRIAAVYFDETGRFGSIDQIPVSYGSDFSPKLKNALHLSIE